MILLFGAAGAVVRAMELLLAFDATGLAEPWHATTVSLIALAVVTALFCLLTHRAFGEKRRDCTRLMEAPGAGSLTLMTLGALLIFGGSVQELATFATAEDPRVTGGVFPLVLGLLGLVAVGGLIYLLAACSGKKSMKALGIPAMLPVFWACFWAIDSLRRYAVDPVLNDYMPEVLAVVFAALGFSWLAGFAFDEGRPQRTLVYMMLSCFCAMVAFFGPLLHLLLIQGTARELLDAAAARLPLLGILFYLLAAAGTIHRNLGREKK